MGLTEEETLVQEHFPFLGDPRGSHNARTAHRFIGEVLESELGRTAGEMTDEFVVSCLNGLIEEAEGAKERIEQNS